MTRKDVRNIKQLHSKRTGALILVGLAVFLVGGSIFLYLANLENEKFEIKLDDFQALSCEDMKKEIDLYNDDWRNEVYLNKVRAGEC